MEESERSRRPSEVKRLSQILTRDDSDLAICAISGPGGVGKTYLLEHVLTAHSPAELGYVYLRVDGSNPETRGDFFGLVADQLAARSLPPPAITSRDYFPEVRRIAVLHRKLVENVEQELSQQGASPEARNAAVALVKLAHVCNDRLPGRSHPARAFIGALTGEKTSTSVIDVALELLSSLEALERKSTILPEPVRERLGLTVKDRVRRDLHNLTADVLIRDLKNALDGWDRSNWWKLTHPAIPGVHRVLVVLDDYEANNDALGDFLVGSLIPRLAHAPFGVTLVICCRDDLASTHPGWAQHVQKRLKEDIRLKPFDKKTALELMAEFGVPIEKREEIFRATEGFPFLLTLAIEEATSSEGQSALFAKKFYERTTRWMTEVQKNWFMRVCYLDHVDEDTLALFFSPDEVAEVQNWFESEASIRDPDSPKFCVRPFIRHRTLQYLEMRSPSQHHKMTEKGRGLEVTLA